MRIFYVTSGSDLTGSERVSLDHVLALRRLGYDAALLIVRPTGETAATFQPDFPPAQTVPWRTDGVGLTPSDFVVVGEAFGEGAIAVRDTDARKVLLNQAPFYTFKAFTDLNAMRTWGCEAIITTSVFAAHMVSRMGWSLPLFAVHPALDPVFAAAGSAGGPRHLRIATIASRRPDELRLIHGIVRSRRPDLAKVPWYDIRGATRAEVARQMAASEIFLSMGHLEGLGLPPLEAMAAGALVVGFYGGGGQEYATAENGDWFQDGAHFEIAQTLIRRIDQLRAGETLSVRRAAGRKTLEDFSQEGFETALAAAWRTLAGPPG